LDLDWFGARQAIVFCADSPVRVFRREHPSAEAMVAWRTGVATLTLAGDSNHCANARETLKNKNMESKPTSSRCAMRQDRAFAALSPDALRAFEALKEYSTLAKGALLFAQGRPCQGVYILGDGRARLSVSSESGRRLLLRVAGPGEILGLGANLTGDPYEFTAELLDSSQVAFIRRKALLKFLRENPTICMEVVHRLSEDLHGAYERVRNIGLDRTRRARLSRSRSAASA
jgi:CRP-like cAMP-binding protein